MRSINRGVSRHLDIIHLEEIKMGGGADIEIYMHDGGMKNIDSVCTRGDGQLNILQQVLIHLKKQMNHVKG